ncbi:MAG: hypothetical protein CMB57_04075 [Euryarchaeota archaeon]|nr:hypothetical protein [Euryarchaeota archaeon]
MENIKFIFKEGAKKPPACKSEKKNISTRQTMPPPIRIHKSSRLAEPSFLGYRPCNCRGLHKGLWCGEVPVYVKHKNTPTDEKRDKVVHAWRALVRSVAGERENYVHAWVYCALKGETRFGMGEREMKSMYGRTYKHHLASALVLHASPNSACRELFVEVLSGFYPENQVQRIGRVESNIQQYYFDKRLLICDQLNYEDEEYKPVLERALKRTSFRRSIRIQGLEPDRYAGTQSRGRPKTNDYSFFDGVSFTLSESTDVREKSPHLLTYQNVKYELLPRTQFVILSDALTFESSEFRVVHEEGGGFDTSVLRDDETRAILSTYYKSAWLETEEAQCPNTWNYQPNSNTTLSMRWLRKLSSDASEDCVVTTATVSQLMEHYNLFATESGASSHLLYTDSKSFGWFLRDLIQLEKAPFTKKRIRSGGQDIVGYTYVPRDIREVAES